MANKKTMSKVLFRAVTVGSFTAAAACIILSLLGLYHEVYTATGASLIVFAFLFVLPLLAFGATMKSWMLPIYVAALNLVMMCFFFYFIDFYTPYVMIWIVPLLISYEYFGWSAFIASSVLLFAGVEVAPLMHAGPPGTEHVALTPMFILSNLALAGVIGIAVVFIYMIKDARRQSRHLSSARREEQIQLNRLNTLLNSLSDVVLTLNRYGRITSQNSAALSFLDTNASLIGRGIDEVMPLLDDTLQPVSLRKLATNLKTVMVRDDIALKHEEDVMRLSLQLSPIHGIFDGSDESDEGCVVILRDITRQKTLEDEKDEFISVASHELRTPVAIAEGSLSNLGLMFDKNMPTDKLRGSIETAHDQILYLAKIINDLSTLSRAERGVGDAVEELDVNQILQDLYLRYQPEAEAKSLHLNLELDSLPHISTSRLYLEEILQNFITNAIKYTREGSVTIHGKMDGGHVICSVSDTGIGISKSDQEKIFEKFFRSEDYRTRETSGTGLGLYVVRKLASKLNTKVEVESRLNHGSTFSFTLPSLVKKDAPAQPQESSETK